MMYLDIKFLFKYRLRFWQACRSLLSFCLASATSYQCQS